MSSLDKQNRQYVSRAGEKLAAALRAFEVAPAGWVCADFGANVGGFTDCLLRCGAEKVFAVDTGYGALAWTLRQDPRVVVMERTNALYASAPLPVDLVVIDLAWTPQRLAVPAAAKWCRPGGRIVSLLKPHFELAKLPGGRKPHTALSDAQADDVARDVMQQLEAAHLPPRAAMRSPLRGKGGNREYLLLF
ncbi:MAG: TlyA family rRNA (cytidine-2'-O)-methyltransferase [Phycisphaerae bacterium]|nr:TlyA family rRNA (cytidine-2'-O)-methyltransferase [Phycisphaerae bacterium]